MYTVAVQIVGDSPLMQHRYPLPDFDTLNEGGVKNTGAKDYSQEWREYLYTDANGVYQPASHILGAMMKAAANFKIQGKRGKSYKDLVATSVLIDPENIPHGIPNPDMLDTDADKALYLDVRPVVVQRARVVRIRPTFKPGWVLDFDMQITDAELPSKMVHEIVALAGKAVGIGDFRPRFGRFSVTKFQVEK